MDRAYTNLLAHLRSADPILPLTTIQSALAHYLAHISPLPTPLAASAVSSTLYLVQPFTSDRLQSLLTAFRHATHLRYSKKKNDIKNGSRLVNLFSSSINATLGQWIDNVAKGIQGGHPILRLSSLSGLLLGILDLEANLKENQSDEAFSLYLGNSKNGVEQELMMAVAEIMDTYPYGLTSDLASDWEKEFQPAGQGEYLISFLFDAILKNGILFLQDVLTLALIIAAQSLPLMSQTQFNILPLPTLNHLVLMTLSPLFCGGRFLHDLSTSIMQQDEYKISIPVSWDSSLVRTVNQY